MCHSERGEQQQQQGEGKTRQEPSDNHRPISLSLSFLPPACSLALYHSNPLSMPNSNDGSAPLAPTPTPSHCTSIQLIWKSLTLLISAVCQSIARSLSHSYSYPDSYSYSYCVALVHHSVRLVCAQIEFARAPLDLVATYWFAEEYITSYACILINRVCQVEGKTLCLSNIRQHKELSVRHLRLNRQ